MLSAALPLLEGAGIETPLLDGEILLAHTLGCERHELYTTSVRCQAPNGKMKQFQSFVERRRQREPVAYITGFKEFWSLKLKVTPEVLIPRPETEEVVEKSIQWVQTCSKVPGTKLHILDLCTGSGCIAAALARELPQAHITVSDISEGALRVAKENLALYKDRITFIQSDLFEKIQGTFDLIVSNPPYIPSNEWEGLEPEIREYEPKIALDGGPEGLDFIIKIRHNISKYLKRTGAAVIENKADVQLWKS